MKVSLNHVTGNFPDFLVVGAAKAGTTSIHHYLKNHPDIFLPQRKELEFWHQNRNPNKALLAYNWNSPIPTTLIEYLSHYEKTSESQLVGEVCPAYLYYYQYVIDSLKDYHPNWKKVKILIILREPVSRIISQYRFVRNQFLDPENLSFEDGLIAEDRRKKENNLLLDLFYKDLSRYTEQVSAYLNAFDNVFICLYDELKNDNYHLMNKICNFLQVDGYKMKLENTVYNKSEDVRVYRGNFTKKIFNIARDSNLNLPDKVKEKIKFALNSILLKKEKEISEELIYMLKREFEQEIIELEKVIGKDLSAWKQSYSRDIHTDSIKLKPRHDTIGGTGASHWGADKL
ncbi:MAG: sulfotransferase [Candidatus Competibacteraceae bacterium]